MSDVPDSAPPSPSRAKVCLLAGLFAAVLAVVALVAVSGWLTNRAVRDIRRDFGETQGVREHVGAIRRAAVDWKQSDTDSGRFVIRVEGDLGRGTIVAIHSGAGHPDVVAGWVDAQLVLPSGELVPLDEARAPSR